MARLNNEILSAWLDGGLVPEAAARVERALAHDADARRRMDAMRRADQALHAAFDWRGAGEGELIAALAARLEQPPRRRSRARLHATVAALSLLAAAAFCIGKMSLS
jgi:anti-sigma factor RsiW